MMSRFGWVKVSRSKRIRHIEPHAGRMRQLNLMDRPKPSEDMSWNVAARSLPE
jgi:hypothetical protein